jgi:serine/threonine protein phosphatase PrpC
MTDANHQMILLDGDAVPDSFTAEIGGGKVVAYTGRSPDKDTENQDTVGIIPYGPDAAVLVVADGAGGLPAGRRASQTAVETLNQSLQVAASKTMLLRTAILNGIESANDAVRNLANGSATTMTVVTIEGRIARMYQVGDSEALITGQRGLVRAQTMAHSPTGFAVEAGFLDEREALHHEERHLVSNFIGTSDMRIDIGAAVSLRPRDTVLVASDGLTDNIHQHEINDLMRSGPLDAALDAIVSLALRRMNEEANNQPSKPDDLSVILFRKALRGTRKGSDRSSDKQ